jgi:hypothetical protein
VGTGSLGKFVYTTEHPVQHYDLGAKLAGATARAVASRGTVARKGRSR